MHLGSHPTNKRPDVGERDGTVRFFDKDQIASILDQGSYVQWEDVNDLAYGSFDRG